jgi:carbamoyl-phosphate synthase small subunit
MVITHRNINDGAIEGIRYKDMPVFIVQFYLEISPGPIEATYWINEFMDMIRECKS